MVSVTRSVLGDHVTDPAAQHVVVELVERRRQIIERQVAQGRHAEHRRRPLARGAALGVLAVGQ